MLTRESPFVGDRFGQTIPADAAAVHAGGPTLLTRLFHAAGTLDPAVHVAAITRSEPWDRGGTGAKLMLSLAYAGPAAAHPPADLFVKFSRNFADPIRDRVRAYMEPEVTLALLSTAPGFPIAVPRCLFADFERASGTGILVTERIAYGSAGIEPHWPKCLDHRLPDPLGHYRALIAAVARLAGAHRGGRLPAEVAARFPFDHARALDADRLPDAASLGRKIERIAAFAAAHPSLLPAALADPAFLARFAREAERFRAHAPAIKRHLHADPDLIALCHWNANIDNAWFWREGADGALACGLLDWGSVGQMSVAMTIWGCLSGVETAMWDDALDALLALFRAEYARAGGPVLDAAVLARHLLLYAGMMGLAYLLDAPARIRAEVPELAEVRDRHDPRLIASETARVQLLMLTNVLHLWRTRGMADAIARAIA